MRRILFLLLFLLIVAYKYAYKSNQEEQKTGYISKQDLTPRYRHPFYARDSLFINYTIYQWIDSIRDRTKYIDTYTKGSLMYGDYHNPKSTEKPRIYIDSILYSPDTLRLYAFVVIEFKGRMMDESYLEEIARYYVDYPDKSFFDGKAVIAYRDDYRDIWKLYPYDHYLPFNGESYSDIRYALRQYYFNEFKKNGETILHKNTLRFKYNVDDPEFWTEDCIVWQKGLRIPGYYNFQTRGNITRESLNPIIPELDIIYPDSLLRLFPGFQTSQDKK